MIDVVSLLIKHKLVVLFYIAIVTLFYLGRKNVVSQAKIIFLYRTKFGIRFIEWFAEKYREWVKLFGYMGAGGGFVGMVFMASYMLVNVYSLFAHPSTPSGVAPVYPGMNVPGLGVLPFWVFVSALFIIAGIHEFCHGIVARAHGLKVNYTGVVLLGPILGAFVEPDEKKMALANDVTQYSVYAAGAFINIITGFLAFIVLSFVFMPAQQSLVTSSGFEFASYSGNQTPVEKVGIVPGDVILGIDKTNITGAQDFYTFMSCVKPNQTLSFLTNKGTFSLKTEQHPDIPNRGFVGISLADYEDQHHLKNPKLGWLNTLLLKVIEFLRWFVVLSLGIGFTNLLPLPIVDGGRMVQTFLKRVYGDAKGNALYGKVAFFFLIVLVFTLIIVVGRMIW